MVATPAAKKVKAPVRELKNKCWNIENYGAEELVFTDAEVMSTHRFQIINCQGTTIRITCKCMVVLLEGCKKVNLYTDRIMNQVDIVNSQAIQVFAGVQFPMVTCESAKEIKVNRTEWDIKSVGKAMGRTSGVSFPGNDGGIIEEILLLFCDAGDVDDKDLFL